MTNRFINFAAFTILSLLWLAFAIALLFNRELLDTVWTALRGWPLLLQLVAWLLFLPVVAGLWIWETSWPVLLRLVLVVALAWMTVYTFNPLKARERQAHSKEPV